MEKYSLTLVIISVVNRNYKHTLDIHLKVLTHNKYGFKYITFKLTQTII